MDAQEEVFPDIIDEDAMQQLREKGAKSVGWLNGHFEVFVVLDWYEIGEVGGVQTFWGELRGKCDGGTEGQRLKNLDL